MLEQALLEVRLPAGIVDTDNIIPGSIRPQNCKMDASWNFKGNVSAGGQLLNSLQNEETGPEKQNASNTVNEVVEVNDRATVGTADIYFLNALKQTVTLTLPIASKNIGRKIYVKRVDKDQTKLCRVLTAVAGRLDGTDGIELNVQESVILIASPTQWHVFSLDFKL